MFLDKMADVLEFAHRQVNRLAPPNVRRDMWIGTQVVYAEQPLRFVSSGPLHSPSIPCMARPLPQRMSESGAALTSTATDLLPRPSILCIHPGPLFPDFRPVRFLCPHHGRPLLDPFLGGPGFLPPGPGPRRHLLHGLVHLGLWHSAIPPRPPSLRSTQDGFRHW